jgi:tetratricopeptide (TPR) repeat protein
MLAHALVLLLGVRSFDSPPIASSGPDSAFTACSAALADQNASKKAASDAEAYYRRLIRQNPEDLRARILLARTLSQCVMSHASVWSKEGIVKESNSLLIDVLKHDSTSWEARYTLALNYYHAPAFFGWTDNAIREFERLLALQGDQSYFPEQAKPYLYLGILYNKKGRQADAKAVWQRGTRLFPDDERLRQRATGQP